MKTTPRVWTCALFVLLITLVAGAACIETDPPPPNSTTVVPGDDAGMMIPEDMETQSVNTLPVAVPGAAQTLRPGDRVVLDGSGSYDEDQDAMTYAWSLARPQDSDAMIQDADQAVAGFVADVPGEFVATLIVSDGKGESVPVTLLITVMGEDASNLPPVADAGVNRQVEIGQTAPLDGSASKDPEGQALTYAWSIVSAPEGSIVEIQNSTTARAALTPDVEGMYQLRLIVSDGQLGSNPALLTLMAVPNKPVNQAPVARQSANQSAEVGDSVLLDGSSSQDPDGDAITYMWTLDIPATSTAFLSAPTASKPSFTADVEGLYTATLVVKDQELSSSPSSSTVTVSLGNQPPVARVGMARNAVVGQKVSLDGGSSQDPDGDTLTFSWALTAKPAGSTSTLSGATSMTPSFVPDAPGSYIAELTVNDGVVQSSPASVLIEVVTPCLVISEYIEGSSLNKAVEFYNCSGATLSLESIRVCLFTNENTTCVNPRPFTPLELIAGQVTVMCNSRANADILAACQNNTNSIATFNGDDRLVVFVDVDVDELFDPLTDTVLDAFGQYGVQPASDAWKDVTYERCSPTSYDGVSSFVAADFYQNRPVDTSSNLGVAPVLSGCP